MTKFSVAAWRSPERQEGRATKAFRLVWHLLCWVTAFAAVIVAWAAFNR